MVDQADELPRKKRIPPGSIKLQVMGDLLFARISDRELAQLFKRYESLLEECANMDRDERILNYKFLIALILTSHAKKTNDISERKEIFDLKNALYLNIANHKANRKKLLFRYLKAKNFRVIKFCDECQKSNSESNLPRHKWKFCKNCEIDRQFFNVLQMSHRFGENGNFSIFLSHELIDQVKDLKISHKGSLEKSKEEGRLGRYQYNVRNLDVFDLESIKLAQKKLLEK